MCDTSNALVRPLVILDHTVLRATRQRWFSRLYPGMLPVPRCDHVTFRNNVRVRYMYVLLLHFVELATFLLLVLVITKPTVPRAFQSTLNSRIVSYRIVSYRYLKTVSSYLLQISTGFQKNFRTEDFQGNFLFMMKFYSPHRHNKMYRDRQINN